MGYTHYWIRPREIPAGVWAEIGRDVQRVLEALPEQVPGGCTYGGAPLRICGGGGRGKPEITAEEIYFNGDAGAGLAHETFWLPRVAYGEPAVARLGDGIAVIGHWHFCKTARKPYDLAVCAALLVAKVHVGLQFAVNSDGDEDEESWPHARDLVARVLGVAMPVMVDNYRIDWGTV